jgi:hypothetical protein
MRCTLRFALAGLLAFALAATCDRIFYARLQEGTPASQPGFDLGNQPDFSGEAQVSYVTVTGTAWDSTGRADTTMPWHVFWEMRADSGRKWLPLASVRYGETPFHAHTVTGPDSLKPGFVYACDVHCYGLCPAVYFEIVQGRSGEHAIRELTAEQFLHRVKRAAGNK